MKIDIVGAGAIGGLIGALLTASGEDVMMIDTREELINLVNSEGQTIDNIKTGESIHVMSRMIHAGDINSLPSADLVVCCTKGYATYPATKNVRSIIGPETYVLSIQNGWGNVDQIKTALGSDDSRLIAGVFYSLVSPSKDALNHLMLTYGTDIIKAGPVDHKVTTGLERIADIFNRAGLTFTIVDNYIDIIWNKLIGNTAMPVAAVLGLTNDELLTYETSRHIVRQVFEESIDVARAMGVKFDNPQNPIEPHLHQLESFKAAKGKEIRGSMPLDIINGRKTEIGSINGAVVTEGKKLGIPTPLNEVLVLLVKIMEERNAAGKIYDRNRS